MATEIEEAYLHLLRIARETVETTEKLLDVTADVDPSTSRDVAILHSLYGTMEEFLDIVQRARVKSTDQIVAHILAMSGQDSSVQKLLAYHKGSIGSIVEDVLKSGGDSDTALLRILEECYLETLDHSGLITVDKYIHLPAEIHPDLIFDLGYESEGYWEHENSLKVDKGYAKAHFLSVEQDYERTEKRRQA